MTHFLRDLSPEAAGSSHRPMVVQMIKKVTVKLRREEALETKLSKEVPGNHVVPGSTRMNAKSGTRAFRMQVVR